MSQKFCLIINIIKGKLNKSYKNPLWVTVKVDGSKPFSTHSVFSENSDLFFSDSWNDAKRLILQLDSLENAYMVLSLFTYSDTDDSKFIIEGVSKIALKSLPIRKKKFSVPLLSPVNTAISIGSLTMETQFSVLPKSMFSLSSKTPQYNMKNVYRTYPPDPYNY